MTTANVASPATTCNYIGIDPSLTGTGVCILGSDGSVKLKTIATLPKEYPSKYHRIKSIVVSICDMLKDIGSSDLFICIERPFVNPKNMNAQQDLIALSYCIRERLLWSGMTWWDVAPMSLKKFVCGSGKAEKSMMLMRVYQNWDISAGNDNEGDAIGLAKMAQAIDVIKNGRDRAGWPAYQLEGARKIIAGE